MAQFYQQAAAYPGILNPHKSLVLSTQLQVGGAKPLLMSSVVDIWHTCHLDDTTTFNFIRVEEKQALYSRLDQIYI